MAASYLKGLQPFIVLDKNRFRKTGAAAALAAAKEQSCKILVIDTVFVEIAGAANAGMDWKDQFEKDFRDWRNDPGLIMIAKGFGALLRQERDTGEPALHSLVDHEMSAVIQSAIRELDTSGTAGLAKYDARMAKQVAHLTSPGEMLDAAHNLAQLRNLLDVWWKHGIWWSRDKEAALRILRKEVTDDCTETYAAVGLAATADGVLGGIEDALLLTQTGYTPEVAKRLMSQPSFTLFSWIAREALSLCYFARGRRSMDITNAKFELNQTLDTTYLGYGLGCRALHTSETEVKRLDAGLRFALNERWPTIGGTNDDLIRRRREFAYYSWINRGTPIYDDWTDWFGAVHAVHD